MLIDPQYMACSSDRVYWPQSGLVTCGFGTIFFLLNAACMPATAKASLLQLSSIVVFIPVGSNSLCLLNLTRHHWQSGTQPHMSHVLGWGLAPAFVRRHTTAFCVLLYSTAESEVIHKYVWEHGHDLLVSYSMRLAYIFQIQ